MNKVLKELLSTGLYLLVVLILTYLFITFVGQRTEVDGESMMMTLNNGDNLMVDKLTYRFKDPERFDIIVFPPRYSPDKYYIKRIIGLPGETVHIDERGTIYINGEVLEESYGREIISIDTIGVAEGTIKLADDEYFVMGDNRNYSLDSRSEVVGNVKRNEITGRAFIRIWPFSSFGLLKK